MFSFSIAKKILRTSFGVGFSQILNLALIPVLSRLYTPNEFGTWAIYYAFITVLGAVSTLRFSDAIVLVNGQNAIKRLIAVCFWSGLLLASVSAIVLVVYTMLAPESSLSMYWLPVSIMSYALYLTGNQLLVKNEKFFSYSIVILCISALPSIFQIAFGYFLRPTSDSLIMGAVLGHLVTAIVSVAFSLKSFKEARFFDKSLFSLVKVYKRYPIYSGGFSICSMLRTRAIYFFLGQTGNAVELSKYAQSDRVLNSPGTVLAAIIRPVFFREISKGSIHKVSPMLLWLLRCQWMVLGPMCGWLFFNMNFLSEFVLGEKWTGVGYSAQCLIFPAFLNMTSNWLDRGYDILKIQKQNFKIELYYGLLIVGILSFAIYFFKDVKIAILLAGITLCFFYLTWIYCLFLKLEVSFFSMTKFTIGSFIPTVLGLILMKLSESFFHSSLSVTFAIGTAISLVSAFIMFQDYRKNLVTRTF